MADKLFTSFPEKTTFAADDVSIIADSEDSYKIKKIKKETMKGASIDSVSFVADDMVFVRDDSVTVTLTDAKVDLKGDQGIQGVAGAVIWETFGIPLNTVGVNGDWAFDTSTNAYVYYKTGGVWVLENSLKGDKGDTGDTGAKIVSGAFVGNNLVFTLDDASTVTITDAKIDLKGDKGDKTIIYSTIGIPAVGVGTDGDWAFDTSSNGNVYYKSSGTWALVNSYRGPQGDTGLTGATGVGITSIVKTNTVGKVDTYTITYTNASTSTFNVTNGNDGLGVPAGGNTGQVLKKKTNADNDTEWGASTGGHTIQEEGSSLTQRTKLNFIGTGVTATDDAGNDATVVTIDTIASGGTPNLTLGTANAAGTAATFVKTDATILAFDANAPTTQAFGDSAAIGSATVAARRDHKHTMMANPVSGTINQIGYFDTTSTVKSLTTATYPSLTELSYVKGVTGAIQTQIGGRKYYHGVVQTGVVAPLPTHITTTTFTLAANTTPITYRYLGTQIVVNTEKTATLAEGAGLYFVYFDAGTGNILATKAFPGITNTSNVLIASVNWNGTDYGIVYNERHGYDRDHAWHQWAHDTIGCRYQSGLGFSYAGNVVANTTFALSTGTLHDEDIDFSVAGTTARIWYQTGASTYAFDLTPSTTPYKASGIGIQAVNSTGYGLVTITASNRYFNYFVYGSNSNLTPIHIFAETVTNANAGGYTSANNARAVAAPSLAGFGLAPEMKLLYRVVVNGAGLIQTPVAGDDYRTTSTVSGGALTSVSASSVTENNYGNVQSAIDTLVANDATYTPMTRTLEINGVSYDLSANRSWTVSGAADPGVMAIAMINS